MTSVAWVRGRLNRPSSSVLRPADDGRYGSSQLITHQTRPSCGWRLLPRASRSLMGVDLAALLLLAFGDVA